MEKRIAVVKRIGKVLALAVLIGVAGQIAAPVVAHASGRKPHCAAVPVPGKPGTYIVKCSTIRA